MFHVEHSGRLVRQRVGLTLAQARGRRQHGPRAVAARAAPRADINPADQLGPHRGCLTLKAHAAVGAEARVERFIKAG